ncbi:MAG: lysoplasmalogenase [Bacillota bacterium]|nr:lysoplasmalogenase [Bacillota bacterium]MDW7682644.1 lysoplasmalogenase [Bacillota bacterium]
MLFLKFSILAIALVHFVVITIPCQLGIYLTKPFVMVLIISLVLRGPLSRRYTRLVLAALLFSLLGDVLLMLEGLFLQGLLAFLVAQGFYVTAFWTDTRFYKGDLAAGAVILVLGGGIFFSLSTYLDASLFIPVAAYMLVISLMVWRAVGTLFRDVFEPQQKRFIVAGAVLFYLSDLVLAVNRFALPVPWSSLIVMATYFAAQYLLASSVHRN